MKTKALFAIATIGFSLGSQAANWPNWRGPNHDGSTDASSLPAKFSKTQNVKWTTNLPGPSAGTPIIWENKVFVSSVGKEDGSLLALCLDRKSGKILWRDKAGSGYQPGNGDGQSWRLDSRTDYASPSPVTDGKTVVFFYGNGDLVAYDLSGNRKWSRNLQKDYGDFTFQWTFSSSPTLYDNRLYMQILQRDEPVHGRGKNDNESFILALNPENGKAIWKKTRPSKANKESLESSPHRFHMKGRVERKS